MDKQFIRKRCEGFRHFRQALQNGPPAAVARTTGVPPEKIKALVVVVKIRS